MISWLKRAQDPISCTTHFIGAIASMIGMIGMLLLASIRNDSFSIILGVIIFGLSSIALYSASWIYHYYNQKEGHPIKKILRKLDHAMIYVLIAGTYTPITLAFVETPHAYYFLSAIWIIAGIGILVKIFWLEAPRMLSTVFYLLMGWALIFDYPAFSRVPLGCFILITIGGILYSIGAIIYIIKKPNWFKKWSFHDIFHIFVMLGSTLYFLTVYIYVL